LWLRIVSAVVYSTVGIIGMFFTGYRKDWIDWCILASNVLTVFQVVVINLYIKDVTGISGLVI